MGTSASSTSPDATASKQASMLGYACSRDALSAPIHAMRASSEKVPCGPR